jgi:hypothetical protein
MFYEKIRGKTTSLTHTPEIDLTATWRAPGGQQTLCGKPRTGQKTPNAATILKIADFFVFSLDQLMRDEVEVGY